MNDETKDGTGKGEGTGLPGMHEPNGSGGAGVEASGGADVRQFTPRPIGAFGSGGTGGTVQPPQPVLMQPLPTDSVFATRKIALIGYAPSVRHAPWNDKSWTIFGLNDQPWTQPRVDVVLECHDPEVVKIEGHWDRLKEFQGPVLMQDRYAEIPSSVRYPLEQIAARFSVPGTDRPYLTCSASLMLAYIIFAFPQVEEVALYGVDMLMNEEFRAQRPSCEFWLGVAAGRGIPVSVQPESGLLSTPAIYGWSQAAVVRARAQNLERRKWLQQQIDMASSEEQQAKEKRLQYVGALADHQYHEERTVV